jgi:tetratricopeptide (TPR) repeat protein
MTFSGESIGVIGALKAFPLRVAARLVADQGGRVHRGTPRGTTMVVMCRSLLARPYALVATKLAEAVSASTPRSENGLMRLLGRLATDGEAGLTRRALLDQSGLNPDDLDALAVFDAFEYDLEPFSFRDLILARKYAGLIATGTTWYEIAKAVHSVGPVGSLTALSLQVSGERIVAKDRFSVTELDGQRLLELHEPPDEAERYFAHAENAEAAGLFAEAATLYGHCAEIDRADATAPFNQGNCLRETDDLEDALLAYAVSLKRDATLVDTWFNCANVLRRLGRVQAARFHLQSAIALNAGYADAVYNLAALEYEVGDLGAAAVQWRRYLELDNYSEWAARARAGLAMVHQMQKRAG